VLTVQVDGCSNVTLIFSAEEPPPNVNWSGTNHLCLHVLQNGKEHYFETGLLGEMALGSMRQYVLHYKDGNWTENSLERDRGYPVLKE